MDRRVNLSFIGRCDTTCDAHIQRPARQGQAPPNRLFRRSAGHGTCPGVIHRAEPGERLKHLSHTGIDERQEAGNIAEEQYQNVESETNYSAETVT